MASDPDDFDKNIEFLKTTVRESFARVYASLKARELKTLRQLDAIRKQCENNSVSKKTCVQNLEIFFENEPTLLNLVSNYGAIDLERLNFDSNTFILEDYITPEDDHMYMYKDLTDNGDLAIEEAALKQVTATDDCVCYVNIQSEDVSKKFREVDPSVSPNKTSENISENNDVKPGSENDEPQTSIEESSDSSEVEVKKIDPTDDWLNSIKNQTETEPSQVTDVMEHSTIACL
ncbi:uncharacterized protein LOC115451829 [Manduca sexta]|uniref:uncharacterized protein LOC115451829 n=1 Tax=Manduca sexta TaxID=7130 RepID=UPI0018904268|nr:uncharacterized protein LOC115451829 [Manduca sexta]